MNESNYFEASECQSVDVIRVYKLNYDIDNLEHLYRIMKKCDPVSAEENVKPKLDDLQQKRRDLLAEINKNRREAAHDLLMCFCCADLACELASNFGKTLHRISRGKEKETNGFVEELEEIGKRFGKFVEHVDSAGVIKVSAFYADMAEKVVEACRNAMDKVITDTMNTYKGKQIF